MKRHAIFLLAICMLPAALAPAAARGADVRADAHCSEAHPGDTVHFSLTVEGLENARIVYADLQMRPAKDVFMRPVGLPSPDFRNLGGGGSAKPDPSQPNIFQFAFTVPKEIFSGEYRGVGVIVRTDGPAGPYGDPGRVDVSHHTGKQVRTFCLNVVSTFGERPLKPEVTDFHPGEIVSK